MSASASASASWARWRRAAVAESARGGAAVFVVDNVVYDVSRFVDEHPGGHEVLKAAAGGDASEAFHDVGHSQDARQLMTQFAIGEVEDDEREEVKPRTYQWEDAPPAHQPGFVTSWKFPLLVSVLITLFYSYFLA